MAHEFFTRLEAGDVAAAIELFAAVDDRDAATDALMDWCESFDPNECDFDDLLVAIRVADRLIGLSPERSDAHMVALSARQRLGRFDEAIALASEHRERPEVLVELFQLCALNGRLAEAEALIPALEESAEPDSGAELYNLGCKFHGKRAQLAYLLSRGAIACGEPMPQAAINAGLSLLELGRTADCVQLTEAALADHPREPNLWANVLDALSRDGDAPSILRTIDAARGVIGHSSRCDECPHDSAPVACEIGCGALLDDAMNALLSIGDGAAACELYDANAPEGVEAELRPLLTHARGLARIGKVDAAQAILDGQVQSISTSDAGTFGYYRARAELFWQRGDRDRAVGDLAAALFVDPASAGLLARDPAFAAVAEHPDRVAGRPIRPAGVPADARWSPTPGAFGEWVAGGTDADGKEHGPQRYYRPNGTLCCECTMEHGTVRGTSRRFHEDGTVSQQAEYDDDGLFHGVRSWHPSDRTTSEHSRPKGMSDAIRRLDTHYDHGRIIVVNAYDAEGRLCEADGTPYPERPATVPTTAFYRSEDELWREGRIDPDGTRQGPWRTWSADGTLLGEEEYRDGVQHGRYRALFPDGAVAVEGTYDEGRRSGAFVFTRRDGEARDCPPAGVRVTRIEMIYGLSRAPDVHYYDREGRETLIDGTPLTELRERHAELGGWFDEVRAIDWMALEDAAGVAHRVPQLLISLFAQDEGGHEEISDDVYTDLYLHLCHEGEINAATAVALPLVMRLLEVDSLPHRAALLRFVMNCACIARGLAEAAETDPDAYEVVLGTHRAMVDGADRLLRLLDHAEPLVRAWSSRLLGCCYAREEEVTAALLGAIDREREPEVRSGILFALAKLQREAGLERVERALDSDSFEGLCAAMALVMARGPDVGPAAVERLIAMLPRAAELSETWARLPWAEGDLIAETGQALAYAGGGSDVIDRLIAGFDTAGPSSAALAGAALTVAAILANDEDEEDDEDDEDGDGSDPMRRVVTAIAGSDNLWTHEDELGPILERFELPLDRAELRELGDD